VGKLKIAAISASSVILILALVFFLIGYFRPKSAGINVQTTPTAAVYIDGEMVGRTPYEGTVDPKEVIIKLIPESFEKPLAPYETRVNLVSGIETIIQRDFAESEANASGAIISFEKDGGKEVAIAIISQPDSAQVTIDGQVKGFTPYKSSNITEGEHTIAVSAPGYQEKSLTVHTYEGYKLTSEFKLAPQAESLEVEEEIPQPVEEEIEEDKEEMVEILNTPTGYLRVRAEPTTGSSEVGRVDPGQTYKLIEEDSTAGWYKIEYVEGKEGWIAKQYAKKVADQAGSLTPTPRPTASPSG
jgi:hypothetical protein